MPSPTALHVVCAIDVLGFGIMVQLEDSAAPGVVA